ncbi:hypothetical protein MCOR29_006742 [Pyricularia oryzae]|uniref:Uncharacterized protein n=1 Tax=Pyricularia oryzae TaxID=318829 RepID=A0A4V1C7D6_PYROR|nr:hypothetical protein MCOR01_007812 [Pyricularia oryzae]KAI6316200.1 hypothetical protein MCOR29_006742 [Pyricularia oryzae]KAI6361746.1 hypothetical protein MCOR31_008548 [Pyricularia oryzae]KAI6379229.1 hypothetical protein MCOR32_004537 [Pyricularia oryzae]KAI6428152.1 hypothetical protein MCOR22_010535 [Pyricularia oryzae]
MKFSAIFAILTLASAAAAAPAESSTHQDANNIIIRNDVNDGREMPVVDDSWPLEPRHKRSKPNCKPPPWTKKPELKVFSCHRGS